MKFIDPIQQIPPNNFRFWLTKFSLVLNHEFIQIDGFLKVFSNDVITRFCFEKVSNFDYLRNWCWFLECNYFSLVFFVGFLWGLYFEFIDFFDSIPFGVLLIFWSCFVYSSPCSNTKDIVKFINEVANNFNFRIWCRTVHLNLNTLKFCVKTKLI